jgi:hypothetical protein
MGYVGCVNQLQPMTTLVGMIYFNLSPIMVCAVIALDLMQYNLITLKPGVATQGKDTETSPDSCYSFTPKEVMIDTIILRPLASLSVWLKRTRMHKVLLNCSFDFLEALVSRACSGYKH